MPDNEPEVTGFFDPATSSISYLIADPATGTAAIVDPVLDFDPKAARTSTTTADRIAQAAAARRVEWILETHTHADHLSAASYLKRKLGSRIGIGAQVTEVQKTWERLLNLGADFRTDGSQFDHLFVEGEQFRLGSLAVTVWHTPGHTPACVTYVVKGGRGPACAFVGDTLFMPDYGTARADFPGGDARRLFQSIRRILSLPPDTRIFVAHDYQPGGRPVAFETTVAEQRRSNLHVKDGVDADEFAAFRTTRDKTLGQPTLLLPAIQVNIRAGALPPPDETGTSYLKIPLNRL
ncbi:MAG TPA: MBL fold metallo-hydrolase [Alphaproteobacteria bacterium]|nr:MBL fold metallo-hydrolase [Alphaproteobacteria bacterium]